MQRQIKFISVLFLTVLLEFVGRFTVEAQFFVIGTGTASNNNATYPAPYGNSFFGARHQFVYRAPELLAAGMSAGQLTQLGFNVTALNNVGTLNAFSIKTGTTSQNDVPVALFTGLTAAYGPVNITPIMGWNMYTLSNPICWDGISNIVVEICFNVPGIGTFNASTEWTTGLAGTPTRYTADDALDICTGNYPRTASTNRPNIRFFRQTGSIAPNASFTGPTTGFVGSPVSFTNTSTGVFGGTTYYWDFTSDGTIDATTADATNIFSAPGNYVIRFIASNCGENDTATASINIINPPSPPTPYFKAVPTSVLIGQTVTFTDSSTGGPTQWFWDMDNNGTVDRTTQNPTYSYGTSGLKTVKLVVCNSAGCDSLIKVNYIDVAPIYCNSTASSSFDTEVDSVVFANIASRTPGVCAKYTDFTNLVCFVKQGLTYKLKVGSGSCGGSYQRSAAAFIDWNRDGDFNDAGERIMNAGPTTTPHNGTAHTIQITIPPTSSLGLTRLRVIVSESSTPTSIQPCGTYSYGETEDYGVMISPITGTDVSANAIASPASFVVGNNTLVFQMGNIGASTITTADVGFQLLNSSGGVLSTILETFNGSIVSLGNGNHTFAAPVNIPLSGDYTLKVWARRPNGVYPDNDITNDTLTFSFCTGLSGNYTISPLLSGPNNFTTFNSAVQKMIACGIVGPVVFSVDSVSFTEQFVIPALPGASAVNTITFRGLHRNKSIIRFGVNAATPNTPAIIRMENAKYLRFENMTIENVSNQGFNFQFALSSDSIIIKNCTLRAPANSTNSSNIVVFGGGTGNSATSTGTFGNNIQLLNSRIIGGNYNIRFNGNSSNPANQLLISNCVLDSANVVCVGIQYANAPVIRNCQMKLSTFQPSSSGKAIDFSNVNQDFVIEGNKITDVTHQGIVISLGNNSSIGRAKIVNNMIGGGFTGSNTLSACISLSSVRSTDIYFNSVLMDNSSNGRGIAVLSGCLTLNIVNNSFVYNGGFGGVAFDASATSGITTMNYNNFYASPGSTFARFAGLNYNTLAAIQGAFAGQNANSKIGNPNYYSNRNLHFYGSQLDNSGTPIAGITTDIDGQTRNATTPDIGADEKSIFSNDLAVLQLLTPISSPCALTSCEQVKIKILNTGTNPASGFNVGYQIGSGAFVTENVGSLTINPGQTVDYTFSTANCANLSTPNYYFFKIFTALGSDQDRFNDTLIADPVQSGLTVKTYPYKEDFEIGFGGWSSGGTNSSWAYGTPQKTSIMGAGSGYFCWVTGGVGTGSYNGSEQSYVISPCFDLSSLVDPVVGLKVFWDAEFGWDGAVLQATTNNGATWKLIGAFGDPGNWYNGNSINSNPGNQTTSPKVGWTGSIAAGSSSGRWVFARNQLTSLIGQSSVKFRIAFSSDASINYDGIAFDDFVVKERPKVNLGADTTICKGAGYTLNAGTFARYKWSTGDTTPTVIPKISGRYTVKVTDSDGFEAADTVMITVSAPVADAGKDTTVCPGTQVSLNALQSPGVTYLWSTSQTTPNITVSDSGSYILAVQNSFGCIIKDTVLVKWEPIPVIPLGADTSFCAGGYMLLNAGGNVENSTYIWSNGVTTQAQIVTASGTYSVEVITPAGCTQRDTIVLTTYPAPIINLGPDIVGCSSSIDVTLNATFPGNNTYSWSTGANSPTIRVTNPGIYFVTVTNPLGCSSSDTILVGVNSVPLVELGPDIVVCEPTVTLDAGNLATNYLWSNGHTGNQLVVTRSGRYFVQASNTLGCISLDTVNVTINDPIYAGISAPDTVYVNMPAQFADASIPLADSWQWSFGDNRPGSTNQNPTHTYIFTGTYTTRLVVTKNTCSDTITKTIVVVNQPVNIADNLEAKLRLYPNPASDFVVIEADWSYPTEATVIIRDLTGREMFYEKLPKSQSHKTQLSLNSLPRGLYLLELVAPNKRIVTKLMLN